MAEGAPWFAFIVHPRDVDDLARRTADK